MPLFLKVILILILGWYLFRLFLRLVLPTLLRYIATRTLKKMNRQFSDMQRQAKANERRDEQGHKSGKTEQAGEYIDYEEIKE